VPRPSLPRIRVRVHERGDRRLDGILRLVEGAARVRPLPDLLSEMVRTVVEIVPAEVVSVYCRDRDALVMAANVGFPEHAVGNVRLRIGEGITGFCAECLRPLSVAEASEEQHYKYVPGIGEERFPVFLAVPLVSGGTAAGVLVLQRRARQPFSSDEIALATALSAPVAYALERAAGRVARSAEESTGAARTARLTGLGVSPGVALGRAELLPSLDGASSAIGPREVDRMIGEVAGALGRACRKLEAALGPDGPRLRALALVLDDERLREMIRDGCAEHGVPAGLRAVAREYARAPFRMADWLGDAGSVLAERAAEIEDLCMMLCAHAQGTRAPSAGAVLVSHRLSALGAALAVAHKTAAVVLGDPIDERALGIEIARVGGLPVVSEVAGLFAWVRGGDRLLVDGAQGVVRVNPTAADVARFRARSRRGR